MSGETRPLPPVTTEPPEVNKQAALALLCVAQFMVVLDVTIVNVALATLQRELHLAHTEVQWVINAYTVAFGGFLLLGGRMGDLLGRRRIFMTGLWLFALSSLAGGLAPSGWVLIVARALQGLGGAMVSPSALSQLTTLFKEGAERNRAFGIWGATAATGGASGVLLGGVLTGTLGWRSVFFVNVPIGIAAALLAFRYLPARNLGMAPPSGRRAFDVLGAVTVTTATLLLVYAVVSTEGRGFTSQTGILLAASATLFTAFVAVEKRAAAPLVRFELLRSRRVLGACLVMMLQTTGPFSTLFFLSQFLQVKLGYPPLRAGISYVPLSLIAIMASLVAARLTGKIGPKGAMILGLTSMTAGLLSFTRLEELGANAVYVRDILPGLLLVGAGITTTAIATNIIAMSGVRPQDTGLTSGLLNTCLQIGAAISLAILVSVAAFQAGASAGIGGEVSPQALVDHTRAPFLTGAGLLSCGIVLALGLIPRHVAPIARGEVPLILE